MQFSDVGLCGPGLSRILREKQSSRHSGDLERANGELCQEYEHSDANTYGPQECNGCSLGPREPSSDVTGQRNLPRPGGKADHTL